MIPKTSILIFLIPRRKKIQFIIIKNIYIFFFYMIFQTLLHIKLAHFLLHVTNSQIAMLNFLRFLTIHVMAVFQMLLNVGFVVEFFVANRTLKWLFSGMRVKMPSQFILGKIGLWTKVAHVIPCSYWDFYFPDSMQLGHMNLKSANKLRKNSPKERIAFRTRSSLYSLSQYEH